MTKLLGSLIVRRLSESQNATSKLLTTKLSTVCSESSTKPYELIPSYKLPLIPRSFNLLLSGGPNFLHEHCDRLHKRLGPIYREKLGQHELVFLADTNMIQTVIANEGKYPHHNVPEAWLLYNKLKNIERGLFFQLGEPWAKLRGAFKKVLLADPRSINRFGGDIWRICDNFIDNWQVKETRAGAGELIVQDIRTKLCKWSIETTGYMLFGARMGCVPELSENSQESADWRSHEKGQSLVDNVSNMFAETSKLQLIPAELAQKFSLPVWRRFERASDRMLQVANEYVSEFIERAKTNRSEASLLSDLISLDCLSDEEISRSLIDLIIAAADTTSNSMQWMLHLLAKHQDVQERLFQEVDALFDDSSDQVDWANFKQMTPYLSAFIKECSRLYPTAPFLARTLERDIVLHGYRIPASRPIVFSVFTTSRMEQYFERALEFRPERWLRAKGRQKPKERSHAYATLPFGVGARMCIGHRLADFESCLLISALLRRYRLRVPPEGSGDVGIRLRMVLGPDRPINLSLTPRGQA